jgi:hypothetical protein
MIQRGDMLLDDLQRLMVLDQQVAELLVEVAQASAAGSESVATSIGERIVALEQERQLLVGRMTPDEKKVYESIVAVRERQKLKGP